MYHLQATEMIRLVLLVSDATEMQVEWRGRQWKRKRTRNKKKNAIGNESLVKFTITVTCSFQPPKILLKMGLAFSIQNPLPYESWDFNPELKRIVFTWLSPIIDANLTNWRNQWKIIETVGKVNVSPRILIKTQSSKCRTIWTRDSLNDYRPFWFELEKANFIFFFLNRSA